MSMLTTTATITVVLLNLTSGSKLHLDRFDGTCRGYDVPLKAFIVIIKQLDTIVYVNSTFNVTEDVNGNPGVNTKIFRCRSKENLDSCETFYVSSLKKFCDVIDPKLNLRPFFDGYNPPVKCPLKKGSYRSYNSKRDFRPFLVFPMGNWYWKSVTEIKETGSNRMLYCLNIEGYKSR